MPTPPRSRTGAQVRIVWRHKSPKAVNLLFPRLVAVLRLLVNPSVRPVGDLGQEEQVLSSERVGRFPLLAVLVGAADRGVVADSGLRVVFPHRGLDQAEAEFLHGPGFRTSCFWHNLYYFRKPFIGSPGGRTTDPGHGGTAPARTSALRTVMREQRDCIPAARPPERFAAVTDLAMVGKSSGRFANSIGRLVPLARIDSP